MPIFIPLGNDKLARFFRCSIIHLYNLNANFLFVRCSHLNISFLLQRSVYNNDENKIDCLFIDAIQWILSARAFQREFYSLDGNVDYCPKIN